MAEDEYGQQEVVSGSAVLVAVHKVEGLQGHPYIRVEVIRHFQGILLERAQQGERQGETTGPLSAIGVAEQEISQ